MPAWELFLDWWQASLQCFTVVQRGPRRVCYSEEREKDKQYEESISIYFKDQH